MTFFRGLDYAVVRAVVTAAGYRAAMDDFTPAAADYVLPETDSVWYVMVYDGAECLGLVAFVAQSHILFDVHACLLRSAWGRSADALRGAVDWMFAHSGARRIVGATPVYLRLALRMARAAGFEQFGVNPQSFLRGGTLHDQVLMGISKGAT